MINQGMPVFRHRPTLLALLILMVLALFVRYRGIEWPNFHPDEPTILTWIGESESDGVVRHFGYASGFFRMYQPVRRIAVALQQVENDWSAWCGHPVRSEKTDMDTIGGVRRFNIWCGVLAVPLVFGLAFRISRSRLAALFAAFLMAMAQPLVEHAHYAETDTALMLALSLALFCWANFMERPRLGLLLLAGAATGLAIGTKYTVLTLLTIPLIGLAYGFDRRAPGQSLRRLAGWLVALLLAVAAGYVWSNPGVLEWHSFRAGLQEGARRTFSERIGLLGDLRDTWWAAPMANIWEGLAAAKQMGLAWPLLLIPGAILAGTKAYRRHAPLTLLFPIVYLVYFVFVAPWTRTQEFMVLMPLLATLAALPLAAVLTSRPQNRSVARTGFALLVAACTLWAVAGTSKNAARTGAIFQWKDPRVDASDWMARHASQDRRLGFENYAFYAAYSYPGPVADVFKIERSGHDRIANKLGCDYVVRNLCSRGRGTTHPLTNRRRPEFEALFQDFMSKAELITAWGQLPPIQPMFMGHSVELYAVNRESCGTNYPLDLTRPAFVNATLRPSWNSPSRPIGSETAVLVDRLGRTLAIGGPDPVREPWYVVLSTEDRAAQIQVKGLGCKRTVSLDPYDVAVVKLERPWWRPSWNAFEFIEVTAATKRDTLYIPCYARLTKDPAAALRMCNDLGRSDRASEFMKKEGLATSSIPALIAALESETGADAALRASAERALDQLDAALSSGATNYAVDGVGPARYDEFSRVRLDNKLQLEAGAPNPKRLAELAEMDWRQRASSIDSASLPLLLSPGSYTLNAVLQALPATNVAPVSGVFEIKDIHGLTIFRGDWQNYLTPTPIALKLSSRYTEQPSLRVVSQNPAIAVMTGLELRWQREDLLAALKAKLGQALTRQPGVEKDQALIQFGPFARLVEATANQDRLRCVIEILRDDTPPLALALSANRHSRWKELSAVSLNAERFMQKGQRLTVELPLPGKMDRNQLGVGLRTDVRWRPGWLPAGKDDQGGRVPLPVLLQRSAGGSSSVSR